MKVWWELQCDANHRWDVCVDQAAEPSDEQATCPVDGLPAVTASRQPPADRVIITIVPAARVVDAVTAAVGHDGEHFLEIASVDLSHRRRTATAYSWEEVTRKAGLFRDVPWDVAVRRWQRAGLDRG